MAGRIFESAKPINVMSTWQKCEAKAQQQATECCPAKSLFDEAPVPEGSWSENYARVDSHNNQILAIGVVSFIITIMACRRFGFAKGHPELSLF